MKQFGLSGWFNNFSIIKKIHFVMGIMPLFITIELFALWFSINALSSVRAYVGGEGLWAKGHKDAIHHLDHYANNGDKKDYKVFLDFIKVPLAGKKARLELEKKNPDLAIARQGFLESLNHPDDIDGMIKLFRRFRKVYYMDKAIGIWAESDQLLSRLISLGVQLDKEVSTAYPSQEKINLILSEMDLINVRLTQLGNNFSYALGEGARWFQNLILNILISLALTIFIGGLVFSVSITRRLSKGINELMRAAKEMAKGNFSDKAAIYSTDEMGVLAGSFNNMAHDLEQNINERKKVEEALNKEKELYENLLKAQSELGEGVAITEESGYVYVNDALCKMYGYTREELLKINPTDLIVPEDHERLINRMRERQMGKNSVDYGETKIIHKDGHILDNAYALKILQTGSKVQTISIVRDITELKRTEIALQKKTDELKRSIESCIKSENEFKGLLESAPDAIIIVNKQEKIQLVNSQTEKLFGYKRDEIIGKEIELLIPSRLEGNPPKLIKDFFVDSQTRPMRTELSLFGQHKDGKKIPIEISLSPLEADEGLLVSVDIRDISERKKNEEALKSKTNQLAEAQQTAHIGSWEWDVLTNKIKWSDELYALFGLNPQEIEASYENYLKYVHPDDKQLVNSIFQQVLKDHQPFQFFYRIIRSDGMGRILEGRGHVYTDGSGKAIKVIGTSLDVTKMKLTEEALVKAKTAAEKANSLKDQFLANMSHEIRTPMNAIIGFTDLLRKKKLGEQELDYVETIKASGNNLLVIINDILDISKIDAGMMVFEEYPMSIKGIFHSLNAMLAQKAKEKKLALKFDFGKDIPPTLLGDPTRLTQILMNLGGNAIKFTEKGNVDVFAKIIEDDKEKCKIEFTVKDTGIGIAEDKLGQLFNRFQQVEDQIARKYGGTGLGLAIAKKLIELQGGTITVKSEINVGSVFTFMLPFKKAKSGQVVVKENEDGKFNLAELSKLKILLVEDNPLNIKLVLSLFSENGLKTDVAEDGKEAVEKVKNNKYDIVLMDIEMPEMNGYDATKIIRNEIKSDVVIIAMTAHAMAGEKEKCLKQGMNGYVSKPVDANVLFEKMYSLTRIETFKGESENGIQKENKIEKGSSIKKENSIENGNSIEKVSDLSYLIKTMGSKKELIKGIIDASIKQLPLDLSDINNAVTKTDYAAIKEFTHKMKSSVSIVGISGLESVLEEMRILAATATGIEKIKELNLKLNSVLKQAMEELEIEELNYA